MAEPTTPARRRARRSTEVSRELDAARDRYLAQLAEQRDKEKRVDDALARYYEAGLRISEAEEAASRKIEPLERAIAQIHEQREQLVTEQRAAQGLAALEIHETDLTVKQVGQLVGLKEKPARQLIAAGRQAAADAANLASPPETAVDREPDRGDVGNRPQSPENSAADTPPVSRAVNA